VRNKRVISLLLVGQRNARIFDPELVGLTRRAPLRARDPGAKMPGAAPLRDRDQDSNFAEIPGKLVARRNWFGMSDLQEREADESLTPELAAGVPMERQGSRSWPPSPFLWKYVTPLVRECSGIVGSYAEIFGLCLNFYLTIMVPSSKAKKRSGVQALKELCGLE
jgi:hypothetical protein